MSELAARTNAENPDPRIAVALILDTSRSMTIPTSEPIDQLNEGFELFCREISESDLARKRTEITVISCGGVARVEIPFTEGRFLQARRFVADGATPLGAAVDLALDELATQKKAYKAAGLEYFRPWLFVLSDGAPTDGIAYDTAAHRASGLEQRKGVSIFAVGVGDDVDMSALEKLSSQRKPLRLKGYSFAEMFSWLSASMESVSDSGTSASSDSQVAEKEAEAAASGESQTTLPSPAGWATWTN